VGFASAGGGAFLLGAGETREVLIRLHPGKPFTAADVRRAGQRVTLQLRVRAGGTTIGGMTYLIDPDLKTPPQERPHHAPDGGRRHHRRHERVEAAHELLEALGVSARAAIERVRVRGIDVRIELDDDDE
jgi:hypothetical protein